MRVPDRPEGVLLVRDVLDRQLVDRNLERIGKVDGLVLEVRPGEPPRVVYLEVGTSTLARRINRRLGAWVAARLRKRSRHGREATRVAWSLVRGIDTEVHVDVSASESPTFAVERWLGEHIVRRIPGAQR